MNVIYQNDDSIDSDSALIKTHSKFEDLEKLLEYVRAYNNKLNVKKDDHLYQIAINKFIRFYSGAKLVYAQTEKEEYHISKRLYELEEILPVQFVRVSNSEIINLDYVSHFSMSVGGIINIEFKNGTMTSSSRRYLKKIKEILESQKNVVYSAKAKAGTIDKKSASKPKQKLPAIAGNIPPSVPSTIPLGEVNINSKLSLDIPFTNTKANKNTAIISINCSCEYTGTLLGDTILLEVYNIKGQSLLDSTYAGALIEDSIKVYRLLNSGDTILSEKSQDRLTPCTSPQRGFSFGRPNIIYFHCSEAMTSHEELDIFTASRITSYVYWGAGDMDTIVANVYHKGGIHVLNEVYFNGKLVVEGYKKRKHTQPRFRIIKDR